LIGTFSWRLAEVAFDGFGGGVQRLRVRRGSDRIDERRHDQAQEPPNTVF
jgi:hypothetical protein